MTRAVCGVLGLLCGFVGVMAQGATYVYVSNAPEKAIHIFKQDAATGALAEVDVLKLDGGPGALAVDPSKKFLLASVRTANSLASFSLDAGTGKLKPLSGTELGNGANAAYVAVDRTRKYAIGASYSAGRVTVHTLSPEGKLGEKPLQTVAAEFTAHCAAIDATNRWVFVPHVKPNAVFQYRLDAATGQLTSAGRAAGGNDKSGPRHLAFHPQQKYAFTSDESGSSVTVYQFDTEKGLTPVQTLSTLPAGYSERNSTAEVKVHPTGKFVWVSNRGHDSLAGFAFDAAQGRVTAIGQTPTEKTPRSFDVDPSGKFIYSAGEGSGKLAAFRVNADTGALERFHTYDIGKSLSWVMVVRFDAP